MDADAMSPMPEKRHDDRADRIVARPLPPPDGLTDPARRRRWELFAPALAACLRQVQQQACESLYEEADQAGTQDRRRLAFSAARELAQRSGSLESRLRDALLRLFVDPESLAECWQTDVGTFALGQCAERLSSTDGGTLGALQRRLLANADGDADAMASTIVGLLAATFETGQLSAHARNVLCAIWSRRLEEILPGLAGVTPAAHASGPQAPAFAFGRSGNMPAGNGPRRIVPRQVLDALTRAQLQALDDRTERDLGARVATWLAASRTPFDARAADRALGAIRDEADALAALSGQAAVPHALGTALRALAPVLARVHCEYAAPHPVVLGMLELLLGTLLDLGDDDRDPRHAFLEDLTGDMLARFRGDPADVTEIMEEAGDQLAPLLQGQIELRLRAREQALGERRAERAREASDAVCRRLLARPGLVDFVETAWRDALLQAHLRYGRDSVPWRRMLVLGQALLTARPRDLAALRPALADALGLAVDDYVNVEATLDALAENLGVPGIDAAKAQDASELAAAPEAPPHHALRTDVPWRLPDGRRRWVVAQAAETGGDVLLTDALGRDVEWWAAGDFASAVDRGELGLLEPEPLLARYASR